MRPVCPRMRAGLVFAILLVTLSSLALAQDDAPTWDRARAKKAEELATRWWRARPVTKFTEWDAKVRAALRDEAKAFGAIPEGKRKEIVEALWKPVKKHGPRLRKPTFDTPFGKATFIVNGTGKNKGLVIGLHGGGEGAGSASEATKWKLKKCMGMYPQGIRLVHDTWNTIHGERFILTLIEIAKSQYQVDPDRVFVAGFSMGGTGSWFMAGRHPDLLAGALPYHGVLMASPKSQLAKKEEVFGIQPGFVPNARNVAMWYTTGLIDKNCMPGTYLFVWDMIEDLRKDDPGGYLKIHFKAHAGVAHAFPPGEPGKGFKFMEKQTRDRFPKTLVWEYTSRPYPLTTREERGIYSRYVKRDYYWLRCAQPRDRQRIRAERRGNHITLELRGTKSEAKGITIFLNEEMIDPKLEVVVKVRGKEIYRGNPAPDFWTVLETMDARLDRSMVFDRRIDL
jgi:Dienelactone hydrolase family